MIPPWFGSTVPWYQKKNVKRRLSWSKLVIHLIGQYSFLQGEDEKTVLNLHKSISFKLGIV